jgi:hypothetical protein
VVALRGRIGVSVAVAVAVGLAQQDRALPSFGAIVCGM